MAKINKEFGSSLLQIDPTREALLEKMRDKLARNVPIAKVREAQRQGHRRKITSNWTLRIIVGLLFIATNLFFFGKKEVLMANLGYQAVPSIPKPSQALPLDEQALYWTYALYDFKRFRSQYGIEGLLAIDQKNAKRKLQDLLPLISTPTLGIISAYTHVAFRDIKSGAAEHD